MKRSAVRKAIRAAALSLLVMTATGVAGLEMIGAGSTMAAQDAPGGDAQGSQGPGTEQPGATNPNSPGGSNQGGGPTGGLLPSGLPLLG
ncbi:MAG TPA: hypothetical protein VE155_12450 [Pseudonocardiaceae bacterium]|jgi:hypothetical protein|nr:hypothetical protein [Pseudonocardiaceae bacterium]